MSKILTPHSSKLSDKQKESTDSLEQSGELVPPSAWGEDADGRVSTPYGRSLTETTTTHTLFEGGEMITIVKDGEVVFNQFYPRYIPNGKKEERK